jgi:phosphatidylglycerophosphate synthase
MPHIPPPPDAHRSLLRGAVATAIALGLPLAGIAAAAAKWGGLSHAYLPKVLAIFGAGVALVLAALPAHLPRRRFGPANRVTLARLALTALLAGLLGESAASVAWPIVGVATLAAALDAVDGPLARRTGFASAFGARFDMETDALLILILALLAWQLGKAGGWIVAAGLLRYLFVGAGRAWRWLERPLPASARRKVVCAVQVVTLVVCLAPIASPAVSAPIAGAGLALLVYSFAVDVAWLRHRAGNPLMETAR